MEQSRQLSPQLGVSEACRTVGVPRSSYYQSQQAPAPAKPRPKPARALSEAERAEVLRVLNSDRFVDCSPREVYATLLDDEQRYLCHWRTMYRILAACGQLRERRNQRQHPTATKPELLASQPNELWSWDITKLKGPAKWRYFYLYVIVDVFSRSVVGWLLADRESAALAQQLIAQTCAKQEVDPEQLTLHADRGSSMRSKPVALLLADLGVTKTHARPYTPNDNPYSEAHFKTLKYRPDFPDRFGSLVEARCWACSFFDWYNTQHRHSALGLMTPAMVHTGQAQAIRTQRQQTLRAAYAAHPERFVHGQPTPPALPTQVWINKPSHDPDETLPSETLGSELGPQEVLGLVPEPSLAP